MIIRRVKKTGFFDVFIGEGWYNWTRVLLDTKTKRISYVSGERLSVRNLKNIYTILPSAI